MPVYTYDSKKDMTQDLLQTYKYGWKTSYYQNTYDSKKDVDEPSHPIGCKKHSEETRQCS